MHKKTPDPFYSSFLSPPESDWLYEGFVEDGFEEVAGFDLGGGELGFQLVTEGHEFIHLSLRKCGFVRNWSSCQGSS